MPLGAPGYRILPASRRLPQEAGIIALRRRLPDLLIAALLLALPLAAFWPQTVGGRTLLPAENLYQYQPYAAYRDVVKAPALPHNALLSDLVLQNMQWKAFIRHSLAQGEIPLWNPHQFAGIPFFAAGQQSTLYPFSLIYYLLPLAAAYGWFAVAQLWLAGAFMLLFARGLGINRLGAVGAALVYQLNGFFMAHAVFPMIVGAAVWLPLILLMVEFILRRRPLLGRPASAPWAIIGAGALGCNVLAGHVEITYYTLLITAYYAAGRLAWRALASRRAAEPPARIARRAAQAAGWLAAMVALGLGLGAVQFIPLFEFASINYRDGRTTLDQVLGWAHPARDLIQFLMPNFYGSPAHHAYFDVFTGQTVPATINAFGQPVNTLDWGIKNYVEGALYLGILPLALALFGLVAPRRRGIQSADDGRPPYRALFALLALASLTFMFGLPTYGLLYSLLPGFNQLHSPFRWIYAVTLSAAVLAGFGLDALARARQADGQDLRRWARRGGWALALAGGGLLAALLASRLLYPQVEPLVDRLFRSLAKAPETFADARMFYSYQFTNLLALGLFTLGAGAVFLRAARRPGHGAQTPWWGALALGLIALDLLAASWGFNPASDPALLDFTPPAFEWLAGQGEGWRYITLDDPARPPLVNANMTWRYGLDDVRGYESIIPRQYVDYMRQIAPQTQLDFNRVAPLFTDYTALGLDFDPLDALRSERLHLLNVRYLITHRDTTLPETTFADRDRTWTAPVWPLIYEDEAVRIWQNPNALPRAWIGMTDGPAPVIGGDYRLGSDVVIENDTGREKVLHANLPAGTASWLVVSETYLPGWRAFVRPRGGGDASERPLPVERALENFQGVNLSPAALAAAFTDREALPEAERRALDDRQVTVRLVYNPPSFQIGLFASFISGIILMFTGGVWAWRRFVGVEPTGGVGTVARNSLAPILLNLFNRGIDFGFAFIMLRILGPEGAGIYSYAVFIFGWFDIFTNFGLNVFLTREVARDRGQAWRYLFNTSALRLLLFAGGVGLLAAFALLRQAVISPPLAAEALLALGLLYLGLLPNSLSTGLSALFYAFERAEVPAAVTTVATINKAVWGVAALLLGFGVVGLAGVSIITNAITLGVLVYSARRLLGLRPPAAGPRFRPDGALLWSMAGESWPLMLNHFLATIFFQIDIVIIEAAHGPAMVGQYSVAYKWVAALNVIPAFFTMALLPVLSRQAREDLEAFRRSYRLAIKLLVSLAVPLAALFTFLAYTLTGILGGAEFLPDGAIATQLMIWSIPIGWINSLTQYALIALDLQRRITRAFFIAVSFNIAANLLFIPSYGYRAAALTTIASEAALIIPFALFLAIRLPDIGWWRMLWRPAAAGLALLVALALLWGAAPLLALAAGGLAYLAVWFGLGALSAEEWARLAPLLPGRLRRLPWVRRLGQPARP